MIDFAPTVKPSRKGKAGPRTKHQKRERRIRAELQAYREASNRWRPPPPRARAKNGDVSDRELPRAY